MYNIPAICPKCGTAFPSGIAVAGNANVTLKNNISGPCPNCGSMGNIPDGRYEFVENIVNAVIDTFPEKSVLLKIEKTIDRGINKKTRPKTITKKLLKKFPRQKNVWNLIPKSKQDAYAVIQILLTILGIIIAMGSCLKEDKETIINQTLHIHYGENRPSYQQNAPSDNRTGSISTPDKLIDI